MTQADIPPRTLAQRIADPDLLVVPGVHDMIAALTAKRLGFDILYGSGFWLTASCHGIPDAGIVGYAEMVERMGRLVEVTGLQVIADADTGYGGLLNVDHTVRGYEKAGVAAIQLEDQVFPKKCGHTPNRAVVATADMVEKVRVACAARRSDDLLVIARTDARDDEGLAAAIDRAGAYRAAGADILFVEGLRSEEEMAAACRQIDGPLVANMSNGGYTPMIDAQRLSALGFAAAIYPALSGLATMRAVEQALGDLRRTGMPQPETIEIGDFRDFCRMIGFEQVWAFEERWGR